MQQSENTRSDASTAEEEFGRAMRRGREDLGLSQRAFASKLVDAGLAVDASAVSRIENGTRAVRIGEAAIIAAVLNLNVSEMLTGQGSRQRLEDHRDEANKLMNNVRLDAALLIDNYKTIAEMLDEQPKLRVRFLDRDFETPNTGKEYLAWVLKRVNRINQSYWYHLHMDDQERADQLQAITTAIVSGMVGPNTPMPPWSASEDDLDDNLRDVGGNAEPSS